MEKRGYNLRTKVDWYNEASNLPPLHNQKHPITKKYWNDFKGIWCSKKSKKNIASTSSVALYDFYYYPIATIKQTIGGGDIVTDSAFSNFHFSVEWKVADSGNSGIIFLVQEDAVYEHTWHTGPEMQVLDNNGHPDAKITKHRAGDLLE
jgi:hypothetical protein